MFSSTLKNVLAYYNAGVVVVNLIVEGFTPGPNPTIKRYITNVEKIYNASNSKARFILNYFSML
jgi:hypothetical protein